MRLVGQVFRAHNPRWAFAPDSGDGAAATGGRFNRTGLPALYTSCRFETAWLEAQQGFTLKPAPLTICAYEVDCKDLADLTDPAVCVELGVRAADLACAWMDFRDRGVDPPTWTLADRLIAGGVSGIRVRSFAAGADPGRDTNVIFWRWSRTPPFQVYAIDPSGRLPRNDLSWLP